MSCTDRSNDQIGGISGSARSSAAATCRPGACKENQEKKLIGEPRVRLVDRF
jgi:hypothetical protein